MPSVFRWAANLRASARKAARPVRSTEADVENDVPQHEPTYEVPEPPVDRHPTASPFAHLIHDQIDHCALTTDEAGE